MDMADKKGYISSKYIHERKCTIPSLERESARLILLEECRVKITTLSLMLYCSHYAKLLQ